MAEALEKHKVLRQGSYWSISRFYWWGMGYKTETQKFFEQIMADLASRNTIDGDLGK